MRKFLSRMSKITQMSLARSQLLRLIERLADFGKLHSPDQFNYETDGIFAIKARCGLRAYGWYHSQRRSVFVISHFIMKKKQKLNPIDIERALRNKAQYEGEHEEEQP
jgi:hypothetical protein